MDGYFVVTLIVGVVSVVLACVAIWLSRQAERQSVENYNRTKDVLAEISEKAAVIESTVNNTQEKLVDTITEIARPQKESQEEVMLRTLLPAILQQPELLEKLVEAGAKLEQ